MSDDLKKIEEEMHRISLIMYSDDSANKLKWQIGCWANRLNAIREGIDNALEKWDSAEYTRIDALEASATKLADCITDLDKRLSRKAGLSIQCDEDLKKRIDALEHRLTCLSSSFECHEHTELQESIQGIRDALKQVKGDHHQRLRFLEEWKQRQIRADGGLVKGLPTLGETDEVFIIPSKTGKQKTNCDARELIFDPKSICDKIDQTQFTADQSWSVNDKKEMSKRAALANEKQKLISQMDQMILEALAQ